MVTRESVDFYTLADIVRFCGAKRRSVQLWAEAGAIVAEPETERAGAGVHRIFAKDEAIVACVVAAFTLDHSPIGMLIHIGEAVRLVLRAEHLRDDIEKAVRDEKKLFLYYDQKRQPTLVSMVEQFGQNYLLLGEMSPGNVKANIVYLNGAFAGLRAHNFL
jgi:hypothetical protein